MVEEKKDWLSNLDKKAEEKGSKVVTLWQLIKFSIVSMLITLIQLGLVNFLYFLMSEIKTPLPVFLNSIFTDEAVGVGNNNWGYILPFFLSNLIANTVGYIINKNKTFKSNAPKWHFILFILVLFMLILFSTWLQGVIVHHLESTGIKFFDVIAPSFAALTVGMIQFVIIFPLQKFVLLREGKEELNG